MIEKEFIPYELALELKQLGFRERCFGHYWENLFYFETTFNHPSTMPNRPESCLAPTYSQAFRWFWENYELDSEIHMNHEYGVKFYTYLVLKLEKSIVSHKSGYAVKQNTYEEAELACLKKLIEIVKEK
jgi:hypothetical protein